AHPSSLGASKPDPTRCLDHRSAFRLPAPLRRTSRYVAIRPRYRYTPVAGDSGNGSTKQFPLNRQEITMSLRTFSLLALSATLCIAPVAHAAYPERPVKLIVAYSPGGSTDIVA